LVEQKSFKVDDNFIHGIRVVFHYKILVLGIAHFRTGHLRQTFKFFILNNCISFTHQLCLFNQRLACKAAGIFENLAQKGGILFNRVHSGKTSFALYFNKGADIGGTTLREGLEENIDNSWEIGLGLEYAFSPALKASAGYLYSSMGVDPQYSSKFLPDLDAHTIGAGAAWSVLPQLVLNFAVGNVFYECDSYIDTSLGQDIEVKYDKNIPFVAAGIQYSF